jgi:hypothetical protein
VPAKPRHWASGTKPPLSPEPYDDDDDLELDRFPLATDEHETPVEDEQPRSMPIPRPRRTTSAVPRVTFRSSTSVPVPRTADPIAAPVTPTTGINFRTHTTDYGRGATSIGGAIVERERRRRLTVVLSVLAVAAVGAGTFALLRDHGASSAGSVAAQPAGPAVKLVVEPADATVEITGAGTFQGSPATTHLAPGRYQVKATSNGYKSWVSTLEVAEGENQTLHVVLAPDSSEQDSELVDRTAAAVGDQPDATVEEPKPPRRRESAPPTLETPEQPVAAASEVTGPLGIATPMALPATEPPPATAAPAPAPTGPLVVPPTAVRKKRGDVPRLHTRSGLPARISAQLCIDRSGAVDSVRLISSVPDDAARVLEKALSRWRYEPYRTRGKRVAACFAVNFRAR